MHSINQSPPGRPPRPPTPTIPEALATFTTQKRWVAWRFHKEGRQDWTKMPYQPLHPSWKAKANDATTWGTAAQAIAAYQRNNGGDYFDGIGIELDGNGLAALCAFDLDNCRNPQTGELHPWVKRLVAQCNSYAEVTPSGTGIRTYGLTDRKGLQEGRKQRIDDDFNGDPTKQCSCEIYRCTNRYTTITGIHVPNTPLILANLDDVMDAAIIELDAEAAARGERSGESQRTNGSRGLRERRNDGVGTSDVMPPDLIELLERGEPGLNERGQPYRDGRSGLFFGYLQRCIRARVAKTKVVDECLKMRSGCCIYEHCREKYNGRAGIERQYQRAYDGVEHQNNERVTNAGFEVDSRGRIKFNQRNIRVALNLLEVNLKYDAFHDIIPVTGLDGYNVVNDAAVAKMWLTVEEQFRFLPPKDLFFTVIDETARQNTFHPVCDYLDSHTWDETHRVDNWLVAYGGAADTPYVRAVGRLMLIAAVRRVRNPGCKFDEIVILEAVQGTDKSNALAALAVEDDWFSDDLSMSIVHDGKKVIEQTRGRWIIEVAELSGMRKAEVEHLKAFSSRRVDRGRMAYGRLTIDVPRQFIVVGTTNSEKYLKDLTGNRRFWPVRIDKFDVAALKRDRDQLWAEAAMLESQGASINLDPSLWGVAAIEQHERTAEDPWIEAIENAIGDRKGKISAAHSWILVGVPTERRDQVHNARLGHAMKSLGFKRGTYQFEGKVAKGYARGEGAERQQRIDVVRQPNGEICVTVNTDGESEEF
jgi:hypothetical protein